MYFYANKLFMQQSYSKLIKGLTMIVYKRKIQDIIITSALDKPKGMKVRND